jgi:hypothetical protein
MRLERVLEALRTRTFPLPPRLSDKRTPLAEPKPAAAIAG